VKAALLEAQTPRLDYAKDAVIRFEEGLIGFVAHKEFVLAETENLKPFRLLHSTATEEQVGFVVLDPTVRIPDYSNQIPAREWEAIGVTDPRKRLAFIIVNIGLNARESTGNFQAPLLINYERMMGRQVILTDSGFCIRTPIIP